MVKKSCFFLFFLTLFSAGCVFAVDNSTSSFGTVCNDNATKVLLPKIITGQNLISKKILLKCSIVGIVTDIATVSEKRGNKEIVVSGNKGAAFVKPDGLIRKSIEFKERVGRVICLESIKDSIYFLNRGGGWGPVSLYDCKGELIWSYGLTGSAPYDMIAGDIDGNGQLEFVVGKNNGVCLINNKGEVAWEQTDHNVWHIEILDINNDGKKEIVHSDAQGFLVIRDKDGKQISRLKLPIYFSDFSLLNWQIDKDKILTYLLTEDEKIYVVNSHTLKKVVQFDAPGAPSKFTRGAQVLFDSKQQPYFAAVVSAGASSNRSILYIYSPNGTLVYHEVIAAFDPGVTAIRNDKTGAEKLLVGGEGEIWEYSLKN